MYAERYANYRRQKTKASGIVDTNERAHEAKRDTHTDWRKGGGLAVDGGPVDPIREGESIYRVV